jgi:hypothetical protein
MGSITTIFNASFIWIKKCGAKRYKGIFHSTWYCCMCCNLTDGREKFEGVWLIKNTASWLIMNIKIGSWPGRNSNNNKKCFILFLNENLLSVLKQIWCCLHFWSQRMPRQMGLLIWSPFWVIGHDKPLKQNNSWRSFKSN